MEQKSNNLSLFSLVSCDYPQSDHVAIFSNFSSSTYLFKIYCKYERWSFVYISINFSNFWLWKGTFIACEFSDAIEKAKETIQVVMLNRSDEQVTLQQVCQKGDHAFHGIWLDSAAHATMWIQ